MHEVHTCIYACHSHVYAYKISQVPIQQETSNNCSLHTNQNNVTHDTCQMGMYGPVYTIIALN